MWAAERLEEGIALPPGQLVLDSFGDEAATIPSKPIDPLDEVAGKRDGDASTITHPRSMIQSMIILNRQYLETLLSSGTHSSRKAHLSVREYRGPSPHLQFLGTGIVRVV